MLIEQYAGGLRVWAPAKVNLHLEVLQKRPDGFHALETLLIAVTLYDTLFIREDESGALTLDCNDATLDNGPTNLVMRTADLLRRKTRCQSGANIALTKRIPMEAGLGGGSSDAAAALAGLNRLWRLGLSQQELIGFGAELGSDVPFFFATPAAVATGRGEFVEPVSLGTDVWLVVVKPPFGLSTRRVFGELRLPDNARPLTELQSTVATADVNSLSGLLHNRLSEPAEALTPALGELRQRMVEHLPLGCLMSGSGTSIFALCRDCNDANRIARLVRDDPRTEQGTRVFVVRNCRQ